MIRAIWTGTISYGLFSVRVKLHPATQDHGTELHRTHEGCLLGSYSDAGHRLSQVMVCKDCGEPVPYAEQGNVFVDADGTTHPLSRDDMASLPADKSRSLDLVEFVDASEIDPLRLAATYFIRPDYQNTGRKNPKPNEGYPVLVAALEKSGRAAIGRMVMRSREHLVAVLPHDGGLIARVVLWADQLRAPAFDEPVNPPVVELSTEHVDQAVALIDALSVPFDAGRHEDRREAALTALIASKRPQPVPVEVAGATAQILDLTAKLNVRAAVAG
jgi:DNA end-binding protein Ku